MTPKWSLDLATKLKIEEGNVVGILNAPNYMDLPLAQLPEGVEVHREEAPADVYLIFADRVEEAERALERAATLLSRGGAIWVAWPKQADSDVSLENLTDIFGPRGFGPRSTTDLDDNWTVAGFEQVGDGAR